MNIWDIFRKNENVYNIKTEPSTIVIKRATQVSDAMMMWNNYCFSDNVIMVENNDGYSNPVVINSNNVNEAIEKFKSIKHEKSILVVSDEDTDTLRVIYTRGEAVKFLKNYKFKY